MDGQNDAPSKAQVIQQLELMLCDPAFGAAPVQAQFLEAMVKAAVLEDREIGSAELMAILFPNGHAANDACNVRVTIHNLKKTLAKYYAHAPDSVNVLIEIPKHKRRPLINIRVPAEAMDWYQRGIKHRENFAQAISSAFKAQECFERTVELAPDFAPGHSALAETVFLDKLLMDMWSDENEKDIANRALSLDPKCWRALLVLAAIACAAFDWRSAGQFASEALKIDREKVEEHLYYWLYLLVANPDVSYTKEVLERQIDKHPADPLAVVARALAECIESNYSTAREWLAPLGHYSVHPHAIWLWPVAIIFEYLGCMDGDFETERPTLRSPGEEGAFTGLGLLWEKRYLQSSDKHKDELARWDARMDRLMADSKHLDPRQCLGSAANEALVRLSVNDFTQAIEYLQVACDRCEPVMALLPFLSIFSPLRGYKDFDTLIQRVNSPLCISI